MDNYYVDKLNSSGLYKVYDTKIDRVTQFLEAEIDFVRERLSGDESILELGAGYGRIMKVLARSCLSITGIDISEQSVSFAKEYLKDCDNCEVFCMDVNNMKFGSMFDVVLCLQNGLSAIRGSSVESIITLAMKQLKPSGTAYFSSYSPKFWSQRLEWFQEQANKGLIGEIDLEKTKDGNIVCMDGFVSGTISEEKFRRLGDLTGCNYDIYEQDNSTVFLVIKKLP